MLENIASERGLFIYSQQKPNSPTIWFHIRYAMSVRHALLANTISLLCVMYKNLFVLCLPFGPLLLDIRIC